MFRILDGDCCITAVRTPASLIPQCTIRNNIAFTFYIVHGETTAFGRQASQRSTLSVDAHNINFLGNLEAISHVVGNHGSLAETLHVHACTLRCSGIT
ncbi:Uncharacterised protein [Mycobacterium tuberculosis]|nr:Uncharacterised protein [Mycobacterium tuberculosis]